MKILLLPPFFIDTHSQRLIDLLINSGHQVICIGKTNPKNFNLNNYQFIEYPTVKYLENIKRPYTLIKYIKNRVISFKLRLLWKKIKPDVTHLIYINNRAIHCTLARIHPLVYTALGGDINSKFDKNGDQIKTDPYFAKALRHADIITSDSPEILKKSEVLARKPINTSLFYFGIDIMLFKPSTLREKQLFKEKLGIPSKNKVILSPRRIQPNMRHEIILEAFFKVLSHKTNILLLFREFGSMASTYLNGLNKIAKELDITENILWVKEMDYKELPFLYNVADIVVNIPEQDGLPVTLFEVSACKVPIITNNLLAYREYLDKGDYYLINDVNSTKLSTMMIDVLENKDQRKMEKLQRNYELVNSQANQELWLNVLTKIYDEVKIGYTKQKYF